ncbi:MAG: sodium:proton antiporter [Alphaproteobacteria bacterium]|nr:sodium:proton antiporter [Alphaproteobacteria bacterium]
MFSDPVWALPFVGLLLSMAFFPIAAPRLWVAHDGKIALAWILAAVVPMLLVLGGAETLHRVAHVMLLEFVPFILLIGTLYIITGGIVIRGVAGGTPAGNTLLLGIGTALAGWIGTTGAAMILVRPLIAANRGRRHSAHVFVFFIVLVANIGGALSPLGDPPLFLGFLRGVDFFWPTTHLGPTALTTGAALLVAFFLLDRTLARRDPPRPIEPARFAIEGKRNIALLAALVLVVMTTSQLSLGTAFVLFGIEIPGAGLARDGLLAVLALASIVMGGKGRAGNGYSWAPVAEVAKLFAAIFITVLPVIEMLRLGPEGPFSALFRLLGPAESPNDSAFFIMTGVLSSFLDNAPTYLVFFNAAGGDAAHLMGPAASTLTAISLGAVFFGANTYIGNAPNLLVRSVVEGSGIRMPSFFGYAAWALVLTAPVYAALLLLRF